jgi:hypothetical protein
VNLVRPRTRIKRVIGERGGLAGLEREHWDDHQDARAFARRGNLLLPEHALLITPDGIISLVAGGAFASGLYVDNHIDVYDGTQLAIDLSLTSHKWALYTDTLTPNFSTDVSYSATNEASGTGYSAGGDTIANLGGNPTTTESPAGTMMYDQDDLQWAAPTSITARGAILYADALGGNNLIVATEFQGDVTSTAGTFDVSFAATGVFTVDWTP